MIKNKINLGFLVFLLLISLMVSCGVPNDAPNQPNEPTGNGDSYDVVYYLSHNDNYLSSLVIQNPNPSKYVDSDGLVLQDLIVPGYSFKGWYTAQVGGERITEIPKGATGVKTLYAQWEKVEYTITFDSPDVPFDSITYTVDKETTLTNPTWFGYTFVGWSIDGKLISSIPVGTTGNLTLHANWTSDRNKAQATTNLQDPSIIEDMDNGQYIFIYEIGSIQNVPLQEIEYIGNSEGIEINEKFTYEQSVNEKYAETITDIVANATTNTSSWTLSEEWNSSTSATNEHDEEVGKTEQKTDSEGNTTGGNYYVSNSTGGATSSSTNSGGSNSSSSKVTTSNSTGINGNYYAESELNTSVDLKVEGSLGAGYGPVKTEISAGVATNVNTHDKQTAELSNSRNESVGTYKENNKNTYWDTSKSASSNWNTTDSYEKSIETSSNKEISNAISQVIYDRYGYTSSENRSENNSATTSNGSSFESTNEYSSTVEYSTEKTDIYEKTITYKSGATGYYRIVTAGTVHVFAVVGYDIATNSYYTYTYSVLDDERHEFLDYSKDNANFNDCENAILPFEIPYFVHEYVSGVVARSNGLTVNYDTGYVTDYEGEAKDVVIPEYVSVDNGDGTFDAVRIRGIEENAFRGNTNITSIYLPKYVSEIPAYAFEGCTSLETVIGYGISKIGEGAFKDCVSLGEFNIDDKITELGANAFKNAPAIRVNAVNTAVAANTISSGAKSAVLIISNMEGSIDNTKINLYDSFDYFALISDGKAYTNLQIDSSAKETFISNMTFIDNTDTPLKIASNVVTLNRVSIENAPGFAIIFTSDNTDIKIYGTINISSTATDAIISKNVSLTKFNPEVAGYLNLTGNYLVCGNVENGKMLSFNSGELVNIDESTYSAMIQSSKVTFDANGGNVSETNHVVYYGQKYGTLPVPTRNNYTFDGWYTAAVGGEKITADSVVTALVNTVLYAHWTPRSFTVTFSGNGGSVSPSSKTVTYGNSYGELPTPTRTYYTFNGWFTSPTGGTKITSATVPTEAVNVTLYAQWTPNAFIVTFNANGGSVSTTSKQVSFGSALGTLPTPTRDYYNFLGWYTSTSYTTKVSSSTVPSTGTNMVLYAKWELKPLSGWVSASSVPSNAQVVDRKWTFTQTYYKTSSLSTMSGWTLYNTTSAWGEYGAWSAWQDGAVSASDSRQVETQKVVDIEGYYEYRYGRYQNSNNTHWAFCEHVFSSGSYTKKYSSWSKTRYSGGKNDNGNTWTCSKCGKFLQYNLPNNQDYYWEESRYIEPIYKTQYRYRDRSLIYTYHFMRSENLESISKPTGDNISNVQELVRYRLK